MVYHALISPQGHCEYNAEHLIGCEGVKKLENGKWYTKKDLDALSPVMGLPDGKLIQCADFLKDSPHAIEKNIKKWRYEIQY